MSDSAGHSIFSATHHGMYKYLNPKIETMKALQMQAAYFLWIKRTSVQKSVLHWAVACALNPNCIAPNGHRLICNMKLVKTYMNCHRYDQSLFTILLANKFMPENNNNIVYERKMHCSIIKGLAQHKTQHLKVCPKRQTMP